MALPIGHLERVRAIAVSGRLLAVGGVRAGLASAVTLYDIVAEKPHTAVELPCHVLGLAGTDAAVFAAGADGKVRRIAGASGKLEHEFAAHVGACTGIAVHRDRVATVGEDGVLRVFGLDGKRQREVSLSTRPLRAVAFDPNGEAIGVGGDDGVVRVVAPDGAIREMAGHDGPVFGLAFTPAADRVVSAGDDGTLRIWFLVGPVDSEVRGAGETGHAGGAVGVLFLPGAAEVGAERFVSCGLDGRVKVWRMNERRKPRSFDTSGNKALFGLVYVPGRDGGAVVTAGDARTAWAFPFDATATPVERAPTAYGHGFDGFEASLGSNAVPRRTEAVKALAALDEPEALELLIKALGGDRDPGVRALAAQALATHRRIGGIRPLRARLDDNQASVRLAAYAALRSLQQDAPLAPIRAALAASAVDVRKLAVQALPELAAASPLAIGLLLERLADADPTVRQVALAMYRGVEGADSPLPLRAAFEKGAADVRADAVALVAQGQLTAKPDFAPVVEKALDDADPAVRRVAFVAMALTRPVLARWLAANDPMFAQELGDVARRVVLFAGPETPEAVAKAKGALLPAGGVSLPPEADREPLIAALACRTPDTALRGARGLALLQDLRGLGALLTLTREPDGELRRRAAQALAALPDPRARRRITWMLNDGESGVRDAALAVLATLETPLDLAERALRSSQEDIRHRGLATLVQHGKGVDRGEELLTDSLDDEATKVRTEAFRTLWAWHQGEPLTVIDRALEARFPDVRKRALDELLGLAKATGSPHLAAGVERHVTAIADRDEGVAKAAHAGAVELEGKGFARAHLAALASALPALRVVGANGARKAPAEAMRGALVQRLEDGEAAVRRAAIDALDALFPADDEAVRAGLRVSHLDTRVRAAEHLAIRRDLALVDPMIALLRDQDLERRFPAPVVGALRQGAATALATLGSPTLLEAYANELVPDDDGMVREQGARGLANAARPADTAYLMALLAHADVAVRSWGAEGLARLGDARGVPVLTGTLRHQHAPIRVGAILSFAALGPEGFGGLLQGLEDPSPDVQRILLVVVLARDLAAYRRGEPPDLLSSALASARHEIRFAAARALELRAEPGLYLQHLVDVLLPDVRPPDSVGAGKPEKAPDPPWPDEEERGRLMVGLAFALAGDVAEQRYAALQTLRLRDRPPLYFREAARVAKPRMASAGWVPETTPRGPADGAAADPVRSLRRLFAAAADAPPAAVTPDEEAHLYRVAFGAYVGLLRQVSTDDETHRVRRDAIDRVADLVTAGRIGLASAVPSLARALDDPHHLVRRAAFAALKRLYPDDPETPLALALLSSSADVLRSALDDLAARGPTAFDRIAMALDSGVAEARKYAFEVLERISPKGSLEPLLAALRSQHADLRIGVLERLATSQDPRVFEALTSALLSDHEDLRLRAAELLAQRKDDRAVDILEGALRSEDHAGRARDALARIGSPAAVRALGARFADGADPATGPNEGERLALVEALAPIRNADAIDVLVERFGDESAAVRQAAFDTALLIAGPRSDEPRDRSEPPPRPRDDGLAFRALKAAARVKAPELRAAAARELDLAENPEADAVLRGLFADRDRDVRVSAVRSYAARVEAGSADPEPLTALVAAGSRELTLPAAVALATRRPDPTATAAVFRALLLYVRAGEPDERPAALLGLGALGDLRALPELEQIAAGGTEEAPVDPPMQAAATEALGKLFARVEEPEVRERIRDRIEAALANRALAAAATRALAHVGGERSRVRLEIVVAASSSGWEARVAAAEGLGLLADPASEAVLAEQLETWHSDLRWAARDALDLLFPADRTRVELHAVVSEQDDLAEPAAAYLADHADAKALLGVLGELRDEGLRERLRFGLVQRDHVPAADLAALLAAESPVARADAAWVVGTRPAPAPADRAVVEAALSSAVDRAQRGWDAARNGDDDDDDAPDAEERAWRMALWAGRRLAPERIRPVAAATLARADAPAAVRVESAHALRGSGDPALARAAVALDLDVRFAAVSAGDQADLAQAPRDPVALGRAAPAAGVEDEALADARTRPVWLPVALRSHQLGGLIELARSGEGRDRLDAIAALGLSADPAAAEILGEVAGDDAAPEDVRKAAFRSSRRVARAQERAARPQAAP